MKRKWIGALLALIVTAGFVTGCGAKKPSRASEESGSEDRSAASASQDSSRAEDASGADSATTDDLVVYSPLPQEILDAAVSGFEAETGQMVTVVSDRANSLVQSIATPRADTPKADLLFGAGAELLAQFAVYFQPYESTESSAMTPEFVDSNGLWTPLTAMPLVLMYSKTQTTRAPAGWGVINGEAFGGWIALANPEQSGTSYTALYTLAQAMGGGAAPDYAAVETLAANLEGRMVDTIAEVYTGVERGDFAVGITLESSAQKYLDAGYGELVGYVFPQEGTVAALEVSAIAKDAAHVDAAQAFIDYVSGAAFQQKLVEEFAHRSVRADQDAPANHTPLADIKLLDYNPEAAVSARADLLERFQTAYLAGAEKAEASSQAAA